MPTTTGENRPNYRSELESAPTGSNPASPTRVCAGHRRFPSRLTAEWEPECATHGIDDHRRRTLVRLQATNGSVDGDDHGAVAGGMARHEHILSVHQADPLAGEHLGGSAVGDDTPVVQHDHTVGECRRQVQVVEHDHDACALVAQTSRLTEYRLLMSQVESGRGFVQQDDGGGLGEYAGERRTCHLPAGERLYVTAAHVFHLRGNQALLDDLVVFDLVGLVGESGQRDYLLDRVREAHEMILRKHRALEREFV